VQDKSEEIQLIITEDDEQQLIITLEKLQQGRDFNN